MSEKHFIKILTSNNIQPVSKVASCGFASSITYIFSPIDNRSFFADVDIAGELSTLGCLIEGGGGGS